MKKNAKQESPLPLAWRINFLKYFIDALKKHHDAEFVSRNLPILESQLKYLLHEKSIQQRKNVQTKK